MSNALDNLAWFGHASFQLENKEGKKFYFVDPFDIKRMPNSKADAIFITHAHPDHANGLKKGVPCLVYASQETKDILKKMPVDIQILVPRKPVTIAGMTVEAFSLEHSLRAPAVGYRITAGNKTIFYMSDGVKIHNRKAALKDIALYVGDGAVLTRFLLVRKKNNVLIGHAPVSEQLRWCKNEGVSRAIFTHCGSEIVKADPVLINEKIDALERFSGVSASIAVDGLLVVV